MLVKWLMSHLPLLRTISSSPKLRPNPRDCPVHRQQIIIILCEVEPGLELLSRKALLHDFNVRFNEFMMLTSLLVLSGAEVLSEVICTGYEFVLC